MWFVGEVRHIEIEKSFLSRGGEVGTVVTLVDGTTIEIRDDWTDEIVVGHTYEFWVSEIALMRLVEVEP